MPFLIEYQGSKFDPWDRQNNPLLSLALCMFVCCFFLLLLSADFFQNNFFQKIISGILSKCKMVWIQIRTDNLSVLILVQSVCKGYQHRGRSRIS